MKRQITSMLLLETTLGLIASGAIIPIQGATLWTVKIDGAVSNPTTLNITQIMAMPNNTIYAELFCYGAYITSGNWTGVTLSYMFEIVEPDQNAKSLCFSATDGYNKAISISEAIQEHVIIAYQFNAKPLPETLRLVIPNANGEFWVSMINHITVSTKPAEKIFSGSGVNPPTAIPQYQMPQPSLKVTPTPTPSFSPKPTSSPKPTPTPSQETTSLPEYQSEEPFPTFIVIAFAFTGTVVSLGLQVYLKKRK